MPGRREVFVNGGYYHVFNKTIDHKQIFKSDNNTKLFSAIARYYRSLAANISFSKYLRLPVTAKLLLERKIAAKKYYRVHILAYSLMPNHFHFLLKQIKDGGVQSFMANVVNSFTRFLNTKFERKGPLFLPRFHAAVIRTEEQLIHTCRYININHYSSGLVKRIEDIDKFQWCSYPDYAGARKNGLTDTGFILGLFGNSPARIRKFTEDHADYQKALESVKHAQKWS